jgi:methyl-accepting chemotaxis protein
MVNHFKNNMILYSIFGILIGFIAAFLISYTVHKPLVRIREGIGQASEGNLTVKVPQKAKDELGQLANLVNIMIDKFCELLGKTKELTVNVDAATTNVLNRSEMSVSLMQDMAARAEEMSANTRSQAILTNQSKLAVGDMSTAIQHLARNAMQVNSSAMTATNVAQEGENQIEKALTQMGIISTTVNSTANIVEGLGAKSQEVGQIVDLITNIADQTNLLALNAAIEAARAGEQGRGFAVVAEEVRKLAEESGEAAQRIAQLINEVQSEADRAVKAMQDGTREVANGAQSLSGTVQAFEHIITAVNTVTEQIQEITAASEEMAASAETAINSIEQTTAAADNKLPAQFILLTAIKCRINMK